MIGLGCMREFDNAASRTLSMEEKAESDPESRLKRLTPPYYSLNRRPEHIALRILLAWVLIEIVGTVIFAFHEDNLGRDDHTDGKLVACPRTRDD
jgi:hypothetical protein